MKRRITSISPCSSACIEPPLAVATIAGDAAFVTPGVVAHFDVHIPEYAGISTCRLLFPACTTRALLPLTTCTSRGRTAARAFSMIDVPDYSGTEAAF